MTIASSSFDAGAEPTNAREGGVERNARDQLIEEKYAAWVSTLSPERQAWELTLQKRLGGTFGGYYLPVYKQERVGGAPTAWDYVEDDPRLPRTLIIGDSISRGYTLRVRAALVGKANVHRAPENCGAAANGVERMDDWLRNEKWDVIHFNFGLHDGKTLADIYERQLREIVARLKKTGAQLVWATTTPRPADSKEGPLMVEADAQLRAIAAQIMDENRIAVDDLFQTVTPWLAEVQNPKDVHFNDQGYEILGKAVAESIEIALAAGSGAKSRSSSNTALRSLRLEMAVDRGYLSQAADH